MISAVRALTLLAVATLVSCSNKPGSGSGGGQDASLPGKPSATCALPAQLVDTSAPTAPATACTTSVTFADPMLGTLGDNGGPVQTMLPAAGSPAVGAENGCPATDARGITRPTACTLGAAEPGS